MSVLALHVKAQVTIDPNPETAPANIGGKSQAEQIFRMELNIPEPLLKAGDKECTIYFTVTKDGKVITPFFKEAYPDAYQSECKRILRYFVFEPAKTTNVAVDAYGSLTVPFIPAKYKTWTKERNKYKLNLNDKPQDTTFVIYDAADKSPEFYKGDDALGEFILNNIEYPNVAKLQNIEGTVTLSFVVEANGYVTNVKTIKTVGGGCTEEAVRVANLLRWKPAEKNGKYVRYKMSYPITFSLKNVNRDNSNSGN
ncbi:MAG: energy transducer TonB [Bacteroidia bacterium]